MVGNWLTKRSEGSTQGPGVEAPEPRAVRRLRNALRCAPAGLAASASFWILTKVASFLPTLFTGSPIPAAFLGQPFLEALATHLAFLGGSLLVMAFWRPLSRPFEPWLSKLSAQVSQDSGQKTDVRSFVFQAGMFTASLSFAELYQSHTVFSLVLVPDNPLKSYLEGTEVWTWNFFALIGVLIAALALFGQERITSLLLKDRETPSRR